jgi:hypothetical protein
MKKMRKKIMKKLMLDVRGLRDADKKTERGGTPTRS